MQMISMASDRDSQSPKLQEATEHYASGYEAERLHADVGQL